MFSQKSTYRTQSFDTVGTKDLLNTMSRFWTVLFAFGLFCSISIHDARAQDGIVLSSYHVSATVNSRLITTSIDMIFENRKNCSAVHGISLQLPRNARVTDLVMDLSDGCQLGSQVKTLDDAVQDFQGFASEGKAAAILTAWDMSSYELEVSIPPNGSTSATLKYQELLYQKLDKVSFQVPMFPGIAVEDLTVDVSVQDKSAGILRFESDSVEGIETFSDGEMGSMHYEARELSGGSSLPRLFNAYFQPGPLPDNGLFLSDGSCFTHIFNPTTFLSDAGSMARKIVFVIDVSGSMYGEKLRDAKESFVAMIDTLEERDTLVIQSFSSKGTESLWGPKPATMENKNEAEIFVLNLTTLGSTNLNGAFLDGIENVIDVPDSVAPILVILTDGKGNSGAKDIARNVRTKNEGGKVKIFSLAFGYDADFDLLLAIAIQNGGRAVRIYEGFGDASEQMTQFYKQELGSILMSDIRVSYNSGEVDILDSSTKIFPVLAAGSEIVVRGEIDSLPDMSSKSRSLKSLVTATSNVGPMEWPVDHIVIPDSDNTISDCRQSFAQARIVELLEYRDAERSIGDELFVESTTSIDIESLSFEERAQKIAIDAGLVWPGLTALVTVENNNCLQDESIVCATDEPTPAPTHAYDTYASVDYDEDIMMAQSASQTVASKSGGRVSQSGFGTTQSYDPGSLYDSSPYGSGALMTAGSRDASSSMFLLFVMVALLTSVLFGAI